MRKIVAGLLLGVNAAAFAQTETASPSPQPELEEIVVTAQKRAESLQDVPISISALGTEQLQQRGITGLSNLTQSPIPGLVVKPAGGQGSLLIVDIRGVGTSDPSPGTVDAGVAIYIDDIYLGRSQGLGTELADPERIEVLKGPQGTLFGRNAEGGAVRIVTRKPTGEFGVDGRLTTGNFDNRRGEVHVNLPAVGGLSAKLDFLHVHHGGYTENGPHEARLAAQRNFGYRDGNGFRGSLRWEVDPALLLDYAFDISKTRTTAGYYTLAPEPVPRPAGYVQIAPYRSAQPATPIDQFLRRTNIGLYNPGYVDRVQGHIFQAQWEMSDALTLKSITSYRKLRSAGAQQLNGVFAFVPLGAAGQPLNLFVPAQAEGVPGGPLGLDPATRVYAISGNASHARLRQHQWSQEIQLVGTTEHLEYVLGGYYFSEHVRDTRQTFFSIIYPDPAMKQPVGVNPFVATVLPNQGANSQTADARSFAAFAQATWTPAFADERLHLTGGLRYTNDRKSFVRDLLNDAPVNIRPAPFKENRIDPAATIAYDITRDINAYLRYAQAYRAGGVSVRSPTFRPFGPEVNKSIELGVKSDLLDRRLRLNVALFQNRISNRQITVQTDLTNPSLTDIINSPGVTRIRGAELEMFAAPAKGLTVGLTYAYQTGRQPAALAALDPNSIFYIQSLPKHAVTAGVDYALDIRGPGELVFHADYAYASRSPGTARAPRTTPLIFDRRDVANARLTWRGLEAQGATFSVAAFVNNIFDNAYPIVATPGNNAILSPPRSFGFELGFQF